MIQKTVEIASIHRDKMMNSLPWSNEVDRPGKKLPQFNKLVKFCACSVLKIRINFAIKMIQKTVEIASIHRDKMMNSLPWSNEVDRPGKKLPQFNKLACKQKVMLVPGQLLPQGLAHPGSLYTSPGWMSARAAHSLW